MGTFFGLRPRRDVVLEGMEARAGVPFLFDFKCLVCLTFPKSCTEICEIRAGLSNLVEPLVISEDDLLEILASRFESVVAARAWYGCEKIPGFSGLTAAELVNAGRGDEVVEYIKAVDAGVYA